MAVLVGTSPSEVLRLLDFPVHCVGPHEHSTPASVTITCREGCWTQLYCPTHHHQFCRDVAIAIRRRGHIGCRTCQHTTATLDELVTITAL